MILISSNLPRVAVFEGILTSKFLKFFALIPACLSSCKSAACHGDEFCWPRTSGLALRQLFEIINLLREASSRGGWFLLHAYGFRSDLRQHFRLEWNGEWIRVRHVFRSFRDVLSKYKVWNSYVHLTRICRKWSMWKSNSGLVSALRFGPGYVHFCVFHCAVHLYCYKLIRVFFLLRPSNTT